MLSQCYLSRFQHSRGEQRNASGYATMEQIQKPCSGALYGANGVKIIPNVNILPEYCWDWCFDGLPQESLIACSTIGRMQNKESTKEFCDGFSEMVKQLNPSRVVVVGKLPKEIRNNIEIINFKSRGQKVRENFGN